MSFIMTIDIKIDKFNPFKCHSCTWSRKMDNYADSAKIVVPGKARLLKKGDKNDNQIVPTGLQFKPGAKISIACGYDGNNILRFMGFIKRIDWNIPLTIECEGYSYQLLHKRINKTYTNTKMKTILNELIHGTDIILSDNIPDVLVEKAKFENASGVQVLEWFKEKMLQTVYFNFNELYVGLRYFNGYDATYYKKMARKTPHRLNWNVIKDSELVFDTDREGAQINIQLASPSKTGGHHHISSGIASNVKILKLYGINPSSDFAKKTRDDKQKINNNKGYTGKITTFLEPVVDLNSVTHITDAKYSERTGNYVIEGIEGSFGPGGGRQKLDIGITV